MTDRVGYLTVALSVDVRTDDVETLVSAISMLQGVLRVTKGQPVEPSDWLARQRVRAELMDDLFGIVEGKKRAVPA